jgi:hypothetical protein
MWITELIYTARSQAKPVIVLNQNANYYIPNTVSRDSNTVSRDPQ